MDAFQLLEMLSERLDEVGSEFVLEFTSDPFSFLGLTEVEEISGPPYEVEVHERWMEFPDDPPPNPEPPNPVDWRKEGF